MRSFGISIENVERQELGPSINAALTTKSFRCSIPRPHLFNSIETSCCLETSHTQSKLINTFCITQRTNAPMPSFWAAQIALIGRPCCSPSGVEIGTSCRLHFTSRLHFTTVTCVVTVVCASRTTVPHIKAVSSSR
jgi:hypothetical protein